MNVIPMPDFDMGGERGDVGGLGTWAIDREGRLCPGGCGSRFWGGMQRCDSCVFRLLARALPILGDYAQHPEVAQLCAEIKAALEAQR